MKILKYKILFVLGILAVVSTTSCSKWLDVSPSNIVKQDDLFSTGSGYRTALNGIYKSAAGEALYGKELMWGLTSVLAGDYAYSRYNSWPGSYGITQYNAYGKMFVNSYRESSGRSEAAIDNLWSSGYKVIANINEFIANLSEADETLFAHGLLEKNLMLGEAYGMRAMMHFDMLRHFAPAPIVDSETGKYIPYNEKLSTTGTYYTTKEVLNKVIADFEQADKLVAAYDTIATNVQAFTASRYYANNTELFFAYRAYRMNHFVINALMARVYNYMGEHQKGFDKAEYVMTKKFGTTSSYIEFENTYWIQDGNKTKSSNDIIFTLSNELNYENYKPFTVGNSGSNSYDYIGLDNKSDGQDLYRTYFNSQGTEVICDDVRYTTLLTFDEELSSYPRPARFEEPTNKTSDNQMEKDMLPIMRLAELYLIKAEYYASIGDIAKAIEMVEAIAQNRDVDVDNDDPSTGGGDIETIIGGDVEKLKIEIINEARREFFSEGQAYFYYKKFNRLIPSRVKYGESNGETMTEEHFTLPKPDSEVSVTN